MTIGFLHLHPFFFFFFKTDKISLFIETTELNEIKLQIEIKFENISFQRCKTLYMDYFARINSKLRKVIHQ